MSSESSPDIRHFFYPPIMKVILPALAAACILVSCTRPSGQASTIPAPQLTKLSEKSINMDAFGSVKHDAELDNEAEFLAEKLYEAGYDVLGGKGKSIRLRLDSSLGKEAYVLKARQHSLRISGGSPAGVFYGIQTMLQELATGGLKAGIIEDSPRYAWRGYMLDEARHFSGETRVKEILDLMAYYKMNRFHWHLTDAQGWRIEIKRYPRLAMVGGEGCHSDPDTPTQYYTQEQIRDMVAYAKARHIEIVPEIDMPGHATASNRAYPEYSGGGSPEHPDFTFNVGKEETYEYLGNILSEIAELFPFEYMHIGGDEVAYGIEAWETDPHVQDLLTREGLETVRDAERYFMHRMHKIVADLGKTLVGWDELLDLEVDKTTLIMWWRHDKPENLARSIEEGYSTVMCPRKPLYFDFVQHESHVWGRVWDGFCPLEDVYNFPDKQLEEWGCDPDDPHIVGIQANVWTELMHNKDRVDFMTFPRLCALAESGWTQPEGKDFASFESRLEYAYSLFDQMGIYYYDHRDPTHHIEPAGPEIKTNTKVKKAIDFRD